MLEELEDDAESEAYCFVEINDVYRRKIIAADNGIWLQIGSEEAIYIGKRIVGFRKNKTFYWNVPSQNVDEEPEWHVNELRITEDGLPDHELNDDVLERVIRFTPN